MIRHYQEKEKIEFMDRLGTYLGVLWDIEALNNKSTNESGPAYSNGKIFTPLTMVINPKILELIQGQSGSGEEKKPFIGGGEFIPTKGQKIISVGSLSREDFYNLLGRKAPKMRTAPSADFAAPGAIPEKAGTPMAFAQDKSPLFSKEKPTTPRTPPRKPRH